MRWYRNPIARNGDFADPFVLRFNGRYYLYCTNPDVLCWTSDNLVKWQPCGPVITPGTFDGLVPFAPEVCLHDGRFYMYTSPSGHGHYVLASDSPTGPFKLVSGNLGHSIDGHVFTDDDGRRYFYWAGDEGIWGCELLAPTQFGPAVLTGASMDGWTEGPFVVKRGHQYHMTMTGNHYLSPGYRICAAVSDHPLQGYHMSPANPLLVSTTGRAVGLGHSSTVLGPDLVSHWIVYHNLNPDASRDLNIDRQFWRQGRTIVLGPSQLAPAPDQPDRRTDWGHAGEVGHWTATGGTLQTAGDWGVLAGDTALAWWHEPTTDGVFTSEHNIWAADSPSSYGIVGQRDGATAWAIRFDPAANSVALYDGAAAVPALSDALPAGYTHNTPHCCHVIRAADSLRLVIDGRLQLTARCALPADRIGYEVTGGAIRIGYTALTHTLESATVRDPVNPVPGRFRVGGRLNSGEPLTFRVAVPKAGRYSVFLCGDFPSTGRLFVDGLQDAVTRHAAANCLWFEAPLPKGISELTFAPAGNAVADVLSVEPAATQRRFELADPVTAGEYGKQPFGDPCWHDFTADASITVAGSGGHGDLLFRATQMSDGGEGDDTRLGINFLLGYSVQLHDDRVVLVRHSYDEQVLAQATPIGWNRDRPHDISIRACGSSLYVALDGVDLLEALDDNPYLVGQVGIRVCGCDATLNSLKVVAD